MTARFEVHTFLETGVMDRTGQNLCFGKEQRQDNTTQFGESGERKQERERERDLQFLRPVQFHKLPKALKKLWALTFRLLFRESLALTCIAYNAKCSI